MAIDQMSRRREEAEIQLALKLSSALTYPMTINPTTDSSTTHPAITYTPSVVPDTFSSFSSTSSSSTVFNPSPVPITMPPIRSSEHSPAISVSESHVRPSPFSIDSPIGTGGNILSTLPPDSTLARELESGFDVWDGPPGHPFKLGGSASSLGGRSEKAIHSSGERSYQEEGQMHTPLLQSLDKPGGVTWSSSSKDTSSNPKQFSSPSTFTPNPIAGPFYYPSHDSALLLGALDASSELPASSVSSTVPPLSSNVSTTHHFGVSKTNTPPEARARPKPKPRMTVREMPTESEKKPLTPATENSMKSVEGSRDWSMGPPSVVPSSRVPSGLTPERDYHTPTLSPFTIRSITPAESDKNTTELVNESFRKVQKLPIKRKNRDLSDEEEGDREEEREKRRLSEPRERKHSASTKGYGLAKDTDDRTTDRRHVRDDAGDDGSDPIGLSSFSKKSLVGKAAEVIDLAASSDPGDVPQSISKLKTKTRDLSKMDSKSKSKINGKEKEIERRSELKSATATPPRSSSSSSGRAVRAKRPMMVPSSPTSTASEPEIEPIPASISKPPTPRIQESKIPTEGGLSVPHTIESQSPSLSPPPPLFNETTTGPMLGTKDASDSTAVIAKNPKKKGPPKGYAYETDEDESISKPVLAPASVWIDEYSTRTRGKGHVSYQEILPDDTDGRLIEDESNGIGRRRDTKRKGKKVHTDEENPAKREKKGVDDEAEPAAYTGTEFHKEELAIVSEETQAVGEEQDLVEEVSVKISKGPIIKKAPVKKGKTKGKGKGRASVKEVEPEDKAVVQEEDMIEVEKEIESEQVELDDEAQKEDTNEVDAENEKRESSAPTPTPVPLSQPTTKAITAKTKPGSRRSQDPASSSSSSSLVVESPRVSIPRHRPPFKREGSAAGGISSPGLGKVQLESEAPRGNSLASIIHKHSTPLRSPSIQTSGLVRPSGLSRRHRIAPLHHNILPQPKKLPPPPVKKVAKKKGDLCEDDFSEGEWEEMEKERLKRERDWCE